MHPKNPAGVVQLLGEMNLSAPDQSHKYLSSNSTLCNLNRVRNSSWNVTFL